MRYAIRRLWRARAFTLTAVVTLALGIAATTAVFAVVDAVVLRPLPYPHSDRLVDLSHTLEVSGVTHVDQSDASFLFYRQANRTLSGVGAYAVTAVNLGGPGASGAEGSGPLERVRAARISAGTFAVLQAAPLAGRVFREREDRPDAPPVALVGERLWRRAFGADPALVGRRVQIDGRAREVVGVMPASFQFPGPGTEVWLPIGIDPAKTDSASFDYRAVARLKAGVSVAAAQADLQQLLLRLPEAYPGRLTAGAIEITKMRTVVRPLVDVVVGDTGRVLWIVLGAVACLLLVGCANVANLFLVRAEARQPEIVVRRALGAGRGALAWEHLSEAIVLGSAGGAVGFAMAMAGVELLQTADVGFTIPRLAESGLNGTVLAAAAGVSLVAALFMAVVPAWRAAATGPATPDAGLRATAGRDRQHVRRALVVVQLALALVLVAGAGLLARSFAELRQVAPGFEPAPAFTFRLALPHAEYPAAADRVRLVAEALDRLDGLAGVQAAGAVTKLPLAGEERFDSAIFIQDRPLRPGGFPRVHQLAFASPGYFRALGIPLLDGRTFERPEPGHDSGEVILSASVAERYWPGGRAVGRHVRLSPAGPWRTVVGVAGNVRGTTLEQPPDETIYVPLTFDDPRWTPASFAFVVRGSASPAALAPPVTRALRALAPTIPLYAARPMADVVAQARARTSFLLLLMGITSGVALALGAVGLFGLIAYVVSLRGREIAIRLALGARPADVSRMVERQAVLVAGVGILAGLAGAIVTTRALASLLFGVAPGDPRTLAAAALTLAVVAAAASRLAARRAARVDPVRALRE